VGDLKSLVLLQEQIIDSAIAVLSPGGIFGYATCSPHLSETRIAIAETLKRHPEMELVNLSEYVDSELRESAIDRGSLTLWTHRHNTDAMFLSVLRKNK
jgi:16S rRNA (cytosine967-C5)-methyltransferase